MKKTALILFLFCLLPCLVSAGEKKEPDYKELFLKQKLETILLRGKLLRAESIILSGEAKRTKAELKLYLESKEDEKTNP